VLPFRRTAAAVLLGAGLAAPLVVTPPPASAAATTGLGDPVFPELGNPGYDVRRYDLSLSYDPATRLVAAAVTIEARATARLTSFTLDSVGASGPRATVDGRGATLAQEGEKLLVTPQRPVPAGRTFATRISYTADPRMVVPHSGWVYTDDGFAVAGQPEGTHSVLPCNDHPSDKARFVVHLDLPEGLFGVANGSRLPARPRAGRFRATYDSVQPMATELLQVAVGQLTEVQRGTVDGVRVRDVVPTARAAALEPALALTPGLVQWLDARLGRFPFGQYGLLPANADVPPNMSFTGLETQTLTLYRPLFLLQPEPSIGSHMMHELTHSWFGNSVTPRTWADVWLNEGHADFYGLQYRYERGWPDSRGFTTLEQRMRYTYSQGDLWRSVSGPVAAPDAANLWDDQRYLGGVLVLYALRERIGAAAFDRVEHTFLSRFRYGNAGTADYIAVASEVTGEDQSAFLRDWLYGTTTPPMPNHLDWTVAPVDPGLAAAATAARSGIRPGDASGTLD
jgi:aminopeptidase N